MRIFIVIVLAVIFISCSKDNKQDTQKDKPQKETEQTQKTENPVDDNAPADTNLTPEEKFSTSVMVDFLDDTEDEDLEGFLEDEVFKFSGSYTGAAVIGLTPSTWLLALEKDNSTKNYLIQKFVDFKTNEYYFRMNETSIKIPDAVTQKQK